jgi:hypothetical protein
MALEDEQLGQPEALQCVVSSERRMLTNQGRGSFTGWKVSDSAETALSG